MKRIIIVLLYILICFNVGATTYYFSNSTGSDANNGTTTSTPWKTLDKFNTVIATKLPGDNFLFNRGDVWIGKMVVNKSGTSGNPITIGAYGTGANPQISGLSSVVAWTNLGSNIWESTFVPSTLSSCDIVLIGGVQKEMGRTPNIGYFTYQAATTNTSITSSSLTGLPNFTGAQVVIRKTNWITERVPITGQTANTINYTLAGGINGAPGYGFFVEGANSTLDIQDEWYYNPTTKKLRIYSAITPSNVQMSIVDTLVYTMQKDFITFDGIDLIGANRYAAVDVGSSHVTHINENITYCANGVFGYQNYGANSATNFIFTNNVVDHINNNGMALATEFTNATISNNIFTNIGMFQGLGGTGSSTVESYGTMQAIHIKSANALIEFNIFQHIGYVPIYFLADNMLIQHNFITDFDCTKMDGGGIYTWNGIIGAAVNTGNKILYNIIVDASAQTAIAGTLEVNGLAHGIYLDARTQNCEVAFNTVSNMGFSGGYNYSGSCNNYWHDNLFYDNKITQFLLIDQKPASNGSFPTVNNIVKNNFFIAKGSTQLTAKFTTVEILSVFLSNLGTFDSNYYARPVNDLTTSIQIIVNNTGSMYTISTWKAVSGNDPHSSRSTFTVIDTADLRLEYNTTEGTVTRLLSFKYSDMLASIYNGTIDIESGRGNVLYRTGLITGGTTPSFPRVSHNNIVY